MAHQDTHRPPIHTHTSLQAHKDRLELSSFSNNHVYRVCVCLYSFCVCFYVENEKEMGDMQISVNLIILFVPCVFSLELTASRDQRKRETERDTDREGFNKAD